MKALTIILGAGLLAQTPLTAQLVSDGATATLSNVTNPITGTLTVGTNGSFTLLVLSNNVLVTNTTLGIIGANATARSNEVRLVSPTARWQMGSLLLVGSNGAFNRLVVTNGGRVTDTEGYVGFNAGSSNNEAVVTGAGSTWSNSSSLVVGELGSSNRMEISDGGWVTGNYGTIGKSASSATNRVLVTGSNSTWSNRFTLQVGLAGNGNELVVSNGGQVYNDDARIGNSGSANRVTVTGAGSHWSNTSSLDIGLSGVANRLAVESGGRVSSGSASLGLNSGSSANEALVFGAGSLWTNQGDLTVGLGTAFNRLLVSNAGWVVNGDGYVGRTTSATNNSVFVTGAGSVWSNRLNLNVGLDGAGNQLIVSNGALIKVGGNALVSAIVGVNSSALSNSLVLTDPGTLFLSGFVTDLIIGSNALFNRLVITNGAKAVCRVGTVGYAVGGDANEAIVTGAGSSWRTDAATIVGYNGENNRFTISDGASVTSDYGYLGLNPGGSNNTAIVTGPGSTWTNQNECLIGNQAGGNRLIISNGATMRVFGESILGVQFSSPSNSATVTDPGSVWRYGQNLFVGEAAPGNSLLVANGAAITGTECSIGEDSLSANNTATLTGANSVWTNLAEFRIGTTGSVNRLVISNGAALLTDHSLVGRHQTASSNSVLVTGSGSLWSNATTLVIGNGGSRSQLLVTNGAAVSAGNAVTLGAAITSGGNALTVSGGSLRVTNASANAVLNVIRGTATFNSGLMDVDHLILTNYTAVFSPFAFGTSVTNNLPTGSVADIYPSSINVTGLDRLVTKVSVTLSNLTHADPGDLDILFTDPSGQKKVMIMSDLGAGVPISGVKLQFDDDAVTTPSDIGPLTSGSWKPRDFDPGETMPSTAPAGPYATTLATCNGAVANGFWRLYINDDANPDSGNLKGWGLQITTDADQGLFDFNGGMLITRGATITTGIPFIVGNGGAAPAIWDVRAGPQDHLLSGDLYFGNASSFNRMFITNGALVSSYYSGIGWLPGSQSNSVTIAGSGSRWVPLNFYVGNGGAFNTLVISNGGAMFCNLGLIGNSRSNLVTVTGSGSIWSMTNELFVGYSDVGNQLILSAGGTVTSGVGILGYNPAGSNNSALVTGAGTTWSNGVLTVGYRAAGSLLTVNDSAMVFSSTSILVGDPSFSTSTNNRVIVDNGTLRVTNAAATGLLEIHRGTNVFNAGLIEADILRVTNLASSRFEFNGGTLAVKSSRISLGLPFNVGNGISPATLFLAGNGTHDMPSTLGLNISSNATLSGSGTLLVILQVQPGGTLSPGASIGKISLSAGPSLAGTAIMEISKNGASLTNDQIQLNNNGTLTYGGSLIVSNLGPTALANGDRFPLFNATSYAGSFSSIVLPALPSPFFWKTNLLVDGSIEVGAPAGIGLSGGSYTQSFDSLSLSGSLNFWRDNSTLLGWYAAKTVSPNTITNYIASDGNSGAGALYSFGATDSGERALGSVASGTPGDIGYGLVFTNDTGGSMSNFILTYTGEQWRNGGGAANTLTFWYRVSPAVITSSELVALTNWTAVTNLNFAAPSAVTPTGFALDGNLATNRQVFSSVPLNGLTVPPGQNVFFRWHDEDSTGTDQGMAVDDLVVNFSPLRPQLTTILLNPTNNFIHLTGLGESNVNYSIEATTNLNPPIFWQRIGSNVANGVGVFQFTDTNAPTLPTRFYRAIFPE